MEGLNWYGVLQSIVTWLLTGFAASCFAWASKTSKRLTILEEHDKAQQHSIDRQTEVSEKLNRKLDDIVANQVAMTTKLDLLLEGRIAAKSRAKAKE